MSKLSAACRRKEFLPISMPITAIAALNFSDMARALSLVPLASLLANREGARPDHSISGRFRQGAKKAQGASRELTGIDLDAGTVSTWLTIHSINRTRTNAARSEERRV